MTQSDWPSKLLQRDAERAAAAAAWASMSPDAIRNAMRDALNESLGSTQSVRFGAGVMCAMHGHEIPSDCYPGAHTRALGAVYAGVPAELWQVTLWAMMATVQAHKDTLRAFGVEFDTWSSEKALHRSSESVATQFLVCSGAERWGRCAGCGKPLAQRSLCVPCFSVLLPGVDAEAYAEHKGLALDRSTVWDRATSAAGSSES